jgi:uncharacterized membrane protein
MRRARFTAFLAAAAVGIVAVAASSATAAPTGRATAKRLVCDGRLKSGTYSVIRVPAGATCNGTRATIYVFGGVRVDAGATFILGNENAAGGGTIRGSVSAVDAASVQLHFAHVGGSVTIHGGQGFFSTVEDNVISGRATIADYSGFWLGFIRNKVYGTVRLNRNIMDDPDANEFVTNRVYGDLICHGNDPAPQVGDSGGSPNVVSGRKIDQCAVPGL